MQFLSIDLETTGTKPEEGHQILEVGIVIGDLSNTPVENLPTFHCYVKNPTLIGEARALEMNARILTKAQTEGIAPANVSAKIHQFLSEHFIRDWLCKHEHDQFDYPEQRAEMAQSAFQKHSYTPAGKNYGGFDLQFLKKLPKWGGINVKRRAIDPSLWFWRPGDDGMPDSQTCMERAGLPGNVKHDAVGDAQMVVQLIRRGSKMNEAMEVLRSLMTNPNINLGDQICAIREREGMGWEGPSAQAWSDAVTRAEALLKC